MDTATSRVDPCPDCETAHLLSSPKNAARLREAMKGPFRTIREIYNDLGEEIPEEFKRLLDLLD